MRKTLLFVLITAVFVFGCSKKHEYKGTVIEFMEPGCPACEKIKPMMEGLKTEYEGLIDFQIIDTRSEEGMEKTGNYGLKGTPTLIFLDKNGMEYFRLEKTIQRDIVAALLNTQINPLNGKK
jgi:thiol-disulfide isomerase/thioredoxin